MMQNGRITLLSLSFLSCVVLHQRHRRHQSSRHPLPHVITLAAPTASFLLTTSPMSYYTRTVVVPLCLLFNLLLH